MFRPMKRQKQALSTIEINQIMVSCKTGILACLGDDGYPYAVTLNYVYYKDKIYFHCAKSGHKMDAMINNPKVSFTVVAEDEIVSEAYTTYFSSVIGFGQARIVEGDEWVEGFKALVEKYSGDQPSHEKHDAVMNCKQTLIVAIDLEHITGKQAKELVKT